MDVPTWAVGNKYLTNRIHLVCYVLSKTVKYIFLPKEEKPKRNQATNPQQQQQPNKHKTSSPNNQNPPNKTQERHRKMSSKQRHTGL